MKDKSRRANAVPAIDSNRFFASTPGLLLTCTFCCLLWGSAFPCIKIGYALFEIPAADTASQMLFAGIRFIIAGAMVIAGTSLAQRRFIHPEPRDVRAVALLSLFQTILQYLFFYQGLSKASGVTSSIVTASSNFIAIVLAALLFKTERLTPRKVLGCIAGFIGVAVINLGGGGSLSFSLEGEGLIIGSAFAGAMSTCLIGVLGKKHDPVMLSGWQFLVGGITLTIASLAAGGHIELPSHAKAGFTLLLYMGFISAMAYSLWSRLLVVNPVSRVSVFGFMNPVFGFLLSATLLGEGKLIEPISAAIALLLVCGGIIAVNLGGDNASPRTE